MTTPEAGGAWQIQRLLDGDAPGGTRTVESLPEAWGALRRALETLEQGQEATVFAEGALWLVRHLAPARRFACRRRPRFRRDEDRRQEGYCARCGIALEPWDFVHLCADCAFALTNLVRLSVDELDEATIADYLREPVRAVQSARSGDDA